MRGLRWRLGTSLLALLALVAAVALPSACAAPRPDSRQRATRPAAKPPPPPTDLHERAGDVPVSISIPSVRIEARVVPTGRTKTGAMAVTADPHIADWFKVGTYPGDQGSAVIAGHSGFAHSSAAFDPLRKVRKGALVYVRTRRGERLAFKVTGARDYPADAKAPEVFDRNDGRYLNLVGCTGTWNAELGTHDTRLVVFTQLFR